MKKAVPSTQTEQPTSAGNPRKKFLRRKHKSVAELEAEIRRLKAEIQRLRARLRLKPKPKVGARKPKRITRQELMRFLKQDKKTEAIASYYRVSESTIKRKIREYGLKGLRKKGRKPFVKRLRFPKPIREWIETRKYIDDLNKVYRFVNIAYPPFKYINPKTLVCSDRKGNPKGKFTTVGVYFIVEQSDVYFINYSRIRYSDKPVGFEEIHAWAKENMLDILSVQFRRAPFVIERIIALTFLLPERKPKVVKTKGE
jgi:hypothetical protein